MYDCVWIVASLIAMEDGPFQEAFPIEIGDLLVATLVYWVVFLLEISVV